MTESQVADMKAAQEKTDAERTDPVLKVYEQAQAAGGAAGAGPDMGGAAGNAGSAPDDDVIDGDFKRGLSLKYNTRGHCRVP